MRVHTRTPTHTQIQIQISANRAAYIALTLTNVSFGTYNVFVLRPSHILFGQKAGLAGQFCHAQCPRYICMCASHIQYMCVCVCTLLTN